MMLNRISFKVEYFIEIFESKSLLRNNLIDELVTSMRRHCHFKAWELFHEVFRVDESILTSCPASPTDSVGNIPEHEVSQVLSFSLCSN